MVEQVSKRYWIDISVLLSLLIIACCALCFYAIPRWQHIKALQFANKKNLVVQPKLEATPLFEPQLDFYTELSKTPVTPMGRQKLPVAQLLQSSAPTGSYVLQLAAFSQRADAQVFADRLAILGYQAFVVNMGKRHKQLYRVCVGPYMTKDAASPDQKKLKKLHIASYIRKIPVHHIKST